MVDPIIANLDDLLAQVKHINEAAPRDDRYQMTAEMRGDVLILHVSGHLLQPAPLEFSQRLEKLLSSGKVRKGIIELASCNYMSSAVLSYLVKYFDLTGNAGGKLILTKPPEKVVKVLKLIGLDSFFEIADDLEAGLRLLG